MGIMWTFSCLDFSESAWGEGSYYSHFNLQENPRLGQWEDLPKVTELELRFFLHQGLKAHRLQEQL